MVLEAEGDVVARLQPGGPEQLRQAVGLVVELGVGDDLAGGAHDARAALSGVVDAKVPGYMRRRTVAQPSPGTVCAVEATERFAELVAGPGDDLPLDLASLLIAKHARPDLDVARELGRLDDLAGQLRPARRSTAWSPTCSTTSAIAGNVGQLLRPAQLLPRPGRDPSARASPSRLSVLAIVVGRRLGVPLAGVGMPGHFLLRDRVDPSVFVDPFGGGRRCSTGAAASRSSARCTAPTRPFDDRFLDPVRAAAGVARMLANLRSVFISQGDRASLLWVLRLRTLLPGASPEDRADFAGCLAATGRFGEAAQEYDDAALGLGGSLGEELDRNAARLRARLN